MVDLTSRRFLEEELRRDFTRSVAPLERRRGTVPSATEPGPGKA